MFSCFQSKNKHKPCENGDKVNFNKQENKLITMLYKDISLRSDIGLIEKEDFLKVFKFTVNQNITRVFSESEFMRNFKAIKINHLTMKILQKDFVKYFNLEQCISCNEKQKIQIMFNLFDLEKAGFLNSNDLRTMFYNYSKSSIKRILNDVEFVTDAKIFDAENIKATFKKLKNKEVSIDNIDEKNGDTQQKEEKNGETQQENNGELKNQEKNGETQQENNVELKNQEKINDLQLQENNDLKQKDEKNDLQQKEELMNSNDQQQKEELMKSNTKSRKNSEHSSKIHDQYGITNQPSGYLDGNIRYIDSKVMGTEMNFLIKNKHVCIKQLNINYLAKKYVKYIFDKNNTQRYYLYQKIEL